VKTTWAIRWLQFGIRLLVASLAVWGAQNGAAAVSASARAALLRNNSTWPGELDHRTLQVSGSKYGAEGA
jgi:hypothetical protein